MSTSGWLRKRDAPGRWAVWRVREKGGQEEAAAAFVVVEEDVDDVDVDDEDVEEDDDEEEEEESLEVAGADSGFLVVEGSPDFSGLTLPARESLR